MKLDFIYNKEKDIWCLLNKGKSSNNSSKPTIVYQELISEVGENPNEISTSGFIDKYLERNNLKPENFIEDYKKTFQDISADYQSIAERVFGVTLNKNITAYLTVNNRCPYSIEENWFFVSMSKINPVLTMMHELWHFYTWYGLGTDQEEKLGKQKYNDLKEALTVLLNIECKDLLPADVIDTGYPQHQEVRNRILEFWEKDRDIKDLWNYLIS